MGGGHYDWHLDIGADITSGRKLSVSVQLSNASNYEDCELEFLKTTLTDIPRTIGSITIFLCYLPHRVSPVTKGIRRSLVA